MPLSDLLLRNAVAHDVGTVLDALADHAATVSEWQQLPLLTVFCGRGHSLRGHLLRISGDSRSRTLLLVRESDDGPVEAPTSMSYIPLSSVDALEVHRAESVRHVLTQGATAPPPTGPVPSQLALKREVAGLGAEVDWPSVPASDEARVTLQALARALSEATQRVRADALGEAALASVRLVTIRHVGGSTLRAVRDGGVLRLEVDLEHALPGGLADRVQKAMDEVL